MHHTPGPLIVKQSEKPPFELSIVNERGDVVHSEHPWAFSTEQRTLTDHREAKGFSKPSQRQEALDGNARQLADLHLWAAAPDLLAACKAALSNNGDPDERLSDAVRIEIRVAIAKAEARS